MKAGKKDLALSARTGGRDRRDLLKAGACAGLGLALASGGFSCCRCVSEPDAARLTDGEFAMFGYCCVECSKCDAYIATRNNDDALRAKVARQWKMKPEQINCSGCKSDNALFNCEAKRCAIERRLPTCAHCGDFASCEKEIWTKSPELMGKVREMRTNPGI
ncbi:MAG: DUF3795 domain-containing protein [Planctomycetota bacterium]